MKDTYIDKIDNVDEIYAFISYEEYLQLPTFKKYMEERDMPLPKKCVKEEPVEEVKSKKNAAAVLTGLFGLLFVVWCLLGIACIFFADKLPTTITGLFVGWEKKLPVLGAIVAATVIELLSAIVAFTRGKKETGAFVGACAFLAFLAIVVAAVMVLINGATVGMAYVVALGLALITFFFSMVKNKGNK